MTTQDTTTWWRTSRYPVFLTARLISQAGDMAAVAALTVHIYTTTHTAIAVAGLFVARVLPRIVGLFAGAVGDRLELRRLLVTCDLTSGVLFLAIAAIAPGYPLLLAMVLLAECSATVAQPAARTMVGRTVPKDHLAPANGMLLVATAVGFAGGSALGSVLASVFDYRWAIAADAASFMVSVLLTSLLPKALPESRAGTGRGFIRDTLSGLSVLRTSPQVLPVFIGLVGISFATAMDRPALIVLVGANLHAPTVWYGVALGGVAVGAVAASLFAMRRRQMINMKALLLFSAGIAAQAVGHFSMGLAPVAAVLVVGALIAGFGNGLESVCGNTLLQGSTPKESLGVLMGLVMSGSFLADAVGSVVGGAVVDAIRAPATFLVAAALILLCGLAGFRPRRWPTTTQGV